MYIEWEHFGVFEFLNDNVKSFHSVRKYIDSDDLTHVIKQNWGKIDVIPGWRLRDIQRWSALIQNTFRSVSVLFITWKSLNSADSALNSAENGNFQSKKISAESELFQRWFSLKQSWTALIFSDTALKNQKSRARKISSESVLFQRWFSLKESWYPLKPS